MLNLLKKNIQNLGLDLKPGAHHYRAYVGPPEDYDLVSAMVFNLLTCLGLRQHHKVLDIGCGSLRNGRLLIPYLNKGNYIGVEPNKWLVDEGVKNEIGKDLIKIKQPCFLYSDSLARFNESLSLDFIFAQSIFSHTGFDLLDKWFSEVSYHLKLDGIFLATFIVGSESCQEVGWVYPGCVKFTPENISQIASRHGLNFKFLNWYHPRQSWAAFYKDDYNPCLVEMDNIAWGDFYKKLIV